MKKRFVALMLAGTMIFGQSVFAQAAAIQDVAVQTDESAMSGNAEGQDLGVAPMAKEAVEVDTINMYMDFPLLDYKLKGDAYSEFNESENSVESTDPNICDVDLVKDDEDVYYLDIQAKKPGTTTITVISEKTDENDQVQKNEYQYKIVVKETMPSDGVKFKDPELGRSLMDYEVYDEDIDDGVPFGADGYVSRSEMESLSDLDVYNASSLEGLETAKNLMSLHVINYQGDDLSTLKQLPGLVDLTLDSCDNIKDMSTLKELSNLQDLRIEFCDNFKDITGVSNLNNLYGLTVWECGQVQSVKSEMDYLLKIRDLFLNGLNLSDAERLELLQVL